MAFDAADLALFCDTAMPGYAEATLTGGVKVDVLFGAPFAEVFGMIAGQRPVVVCKAGVIAQKASVTVNGTAYSALTVKQGRGGMDVIELGT